MKKKLLATSRFDTMPNEFQEAVTELKRAFWDEVRKVLTPVLDWLARLFDKFKGS